MASATVPRYRWYAASTDLAAVTAPASLASTRSGRSARASGAAPAGSGGIDAGSASAAAAARIRTFMSQLPGDAGPAQQPRLQPRDRSEHHHLAERALQRQAEHLPPADEKDHDRPKH